MDPVTVGLVTNFLAAGLTKGATGSRRILVDTLRKNEFSTEIDAVETEFNRSLQSAIEEINAESEMVELGGVEENWDEIVKQLYGLDDDIELEGENASERLVFDSEEDAVEKIAHAIADADGYAFDENPQLERNLKRSVSEAYREAVDSFGDRIVEAGLSQEFVVETNIEEIEELDRLGDRIEDLEKQFTQPTFYDLFGGDEEGRRRASKRIEPQALEFVSRPELEGKGECERLLLLGPGGSGKSRALAELVATYDQDIQHVIVPRAPLQSPQDLQPLRNESFEGDVLLVWDDIHSISPETDNTVFRKAIDELEDILSPDHDLYVLAAARSNHVESLPGDVQKTGSPLWSEFEMTELAEFGEGAIEALFDRVLAKEDVAVSGAVRETFLQKALDTDPSPLYVISIVETADGERLTMDDIEALPEDALAIWEDQYADIKAANDRRRFVLWAVKLLSEVRVPYYHSLLKGIYTHVLNRDELTFGPPVEELCQRQWLVSPNDETDEVVRYTIHDVKLEAIDESIEQQLRDFSTFVFEEVERYLPPDEFRTGDFIYEHDGKYVLHKHIGDRLRWHDGQLAAEHYEQALTIAPKSWKAHDKYAFLLKHELDAPKEAKYHYEQALSINPDRNDIRVKYGDLLKDELDAPEEAKYYYERALAIYSDESIGYIIPTSYIYAHRGYANLLKNEFDARGEARKHFEAAIWGWRDIDVYIKYILDDLHNLIQICRDMDDEKAALVYCKHSLNLIDDTVPNESNKLWFESVHAILTNTDPQMRYTYGLTNVPEDNIELATELFEIVWTERDDHPSSSDTYQLALSAGIALAANIQLHDDLDVSHTCDEILNSIDPAQLTSPANTVYHYLDTGTTTTTPDDLRTRTTEVDEEMTVDALEPRAFAELLELLENE